MAFDDTRVYGFLDATSKLGLDLYAAAKEPPRVGKVDVSKKAKKAAKRDSTAQRDKATKRAAPAKAEDDGEGGPTSANFACQWHKTVPVNARGMVLSGDTLFIAGPERFDEKAAYAELAACRTDDAKLSPLLADAMASVEGKKGSLLWAVNKSNGRKLASCKLDSAPVFDGLIGADGRLYVSTMAGRVICLGP